MTGPARFAAACAIAVAGAVAVFVLHPRIGVRDADAVAYVTGAMSIQDGHGYVDLSGHALNHWPPGYSWLLSWFRTPLGAARTINYAALGLAAASLFWNATAAGWAAPSAVAISVVVALGLFRGLATNAAPDILAYAAFLSVLPAYRNPGRLWWLPYVVWSSLVALKLIAVIFVPAALLAAWWTGDRPSGVRLALPVASWAAVVAAVLTFNVSTFGHALPASYEPASLRSFVEAVMLVVEGAFRQGLAFWYGSIRPWHVLVPFAAVAALGIWCCASLQRAPSGARLMAFGVMLLVLTFALQCVRQYSGGWRLTAYGFLAVILALQTRPASNRRWLAYATASAAFAIFNAVSVNATGANDARYAALSAAVAARAPQAGLETNSYHLLDVHQRIATTPVTDMSSVKGRDFLWVRLPAFDAIATTVWPIERPSHGWCEAAEFNGATLLRRCETP